MPENNTTAPTYTHTHLAITQSQLAMAVAAPTVHIPPTGQRERVLFSTGDLNHRSVSELHNDLRLAIARK